MAKFEQYDDADILELDESLEIDSPEMTDDLLMNDTWFALHPEKVLGEPYTASGRFGPVTKWRGDMSVLSRIDADDNLLTVMLPYIDPTASITDSTNVNTQILKPDAIANVEAAIAKADESNAQKRKRKEAAVLKPMSSPVGELVSFEQMYRRLNPEISKEELAAWVWWKSSIGQPLSKNYVALLHPEKFDADDDMKQTYRYDVSNDVLKAWVQTGVLHYYNGKLYPAVVYLSGDMYSKKMAIDSEADEIIEKFGQLALNIQRMAIDNAFRSVYERRLVISMDKDSLNLKPFSKFSMEFMIGVIESFSKDKWKIKPITSQTVGKLGDPDIINDGKEFDYSRKEFDRISLTDAFGWWLLYKTPELRKTVTHLEIYRHYAQQKAVRVEGMTSEDENVKAKAKERKASIEKEVQEEGERLFPIFLNEELKPNDKIRLETQWNAEYNNYLPPTLDKVPVAFTMAKYVFGKEEEIKPEKREAVAHAMMNGTAVISYDVGVGKTPSAIFTISAFLDAGYCKRPCIVVPNQVYKQFISEIKIFTPQIPVTELYNLSKDYLSSLMDADDNIQAIPEGTIAMATYDGMENISFSQNTVQTIVNQVFEIIEQGIDRNDKRAIEKLKEKSERFAGIAQKGGMVEIESLGIDFMCYDEAHAMKKVFTTVKGEAEEDEKGKQKRGKNPYQISSGEPSNRALKGFAINQYILQNYGNKNVILLTATPFTNSPLEIYSMLSMVGYHVLVQEGINNIKTFFDTFIRTSTELVINTKLQPQYKEVVLGFNNATALRTLIRRFIIYKTGNDIVPPIKRPKKWVLPLTKKIEDGRTVILPEGERVDCFITMTGLQKELMNDIVAYVETGESPFKLDSLDLGEDEYEEGGEVSRTELFARGGSVDKGNKDDEGFGMKILSDDKQKGIRAIQGLNLGRNLAVSPYLLPFSGLKDPTYKEYIETSPKLTYVMRCIASVRDYHISRNESVSGQVIFLDRGVQYLGLVKEYLVKEIGYQPNEVGIIKSGLPAKGTTSKEYVKNLFNGEVYNEITKTFETVPDSQRIKVVIGTSTIKEGMNLQKYGTTLYNCFIDWNPTDMQQLEGRIWRQKNTFDNVRIVNALLLDSTDIFLFQKLQEKTSRLQSIWAADNKNVIELEELNAEEVKYALIRDPQIIAELKILEEKTSVEQDKLGFSRQDEIINNIVGQAKTVKRLMKDQIDTLNEYRNYVPTGDLWADTQKIFDLTQDASKKATDKFGKKVYDWYERRRLKPEQLADASDLENTFSKKYNFDTWAVALRDLKRYKKTFLDQYGIDLNFDNPESSFVDFQNKRKAAMESIDERLKIIGSPDYKEQVIQDVIEEKERQKITEKSMDAVVQDFSRLNYLLAKKLEIPKQPMFTSCPPKNADGTNSITPEALSFLAGCLSKEPQTKNLYLQKDGTYIPERRGLHDKIIREAFEDVRCVRKDKPIAILTGGSPGSGKTTFLRKNADWLLSDRVFHIDADVMREKLPEYKGWNAGATHLEIRDVVERILSELGSEKCRFDLVYDGTMAKSERYFGLVKRLKELGYEVFVLFMEIPYAEARARVLDRYKMGGDKGRYVDISIVDQFFEKVGDKTRGQASLDALKPMVDGFIVADGITGRILQEGGKPMPTNRDDVYGEALAKAERERAEKASKAKKSAIPTINRAFIIQQIESISIALEFLDGDALEAAVDQISALEIAIEYI